MQVLGSCRYVSPCTFVYLVYRRLTLDTSITLIAYMRSLILSQASDPASADPNGSSAEEVASN